MSSRLSVPVSKFTRSISSTPSISRPSHLLNNGSKTTPAKTGRKRQTKVVATASAAAVRSEEAPDTADSTRSHSTASTPHRPVAPPAPRKMPLMQGFRTSAPKPARQDRSSIDFAVFPDLRAQDPAVDPYARIRVPLLPDNDSPPAFARAPEAFDAPLPRPEISVVAANPDLVLPSALTEVEGMGVDGVELTFAHDLHHRSGGGGGGGAAHEPAGGQGMLRDIWKGLVEDVFGEKNAKKPSI